MGEKPEIISKAYLSIFSGHTNIKDSEFICFGVKGLMDTNKRLKDTLLFNILSFTSNQLLGKGTLLQQ